MMSYKRLFRNYVKKSWQRGQMIVVEFFMKWKHWNLPYAIYSTVWWIAWYSPISMKKIIWWGFRKKTRFLDCYVASNYEDILSKYKKRDVILGSAGKAVSEYKIWFFWYQGIDLAPAVVKKCYTELIKFNGDDVVLLSKESIKKYVDIPDYIESKLNAGIISKTHYSDLLRVTLLSQYGGIRVDATSFTTEKVPDFVKDLKLYSIRKGGMSDIPLWANYRWCSYCIGCSSINYLLFEFVRDMWLEYWKKENYLIDYLFTDYLFYWAYNNLSSIHEDIDDIPENNVHHNVLHFLLNKPFKEEKYQEIKQWFYKLSWKGYYEKYTASGELTFYGKLIDE